MFKQPGVYAARVWGEVLPPFRNRAKLVSLKDLSKTVSLAARIDCFKAFPFVLEID
jgi:hypothetical protein